MRKRTKVVATTLVALAIGIVGAEAAQADTNGHGFDVILPVAQFPGVTNTQTKTYSNVAGSVWDLHVGSSYRVDGMECSGTYCGTKARNLLGDAYGVFKNSISAGSSTFLEMQVSTWNLVKVEASGYFAGN